MGVLQPVAGVSNNCARNDWLIASKSIHNTSSKVWKAQHAGSDHFCGKLAQPSGLTLPLQFSSFWTLSGKAGNRTRSNLGNRIDQTVVTSMATGDASGAPVQHDPHQGHAVLHDFCMTIPYSTIALAFGVITACFRGGLLSYYAMGNGVLMAILSVVSLRAWKQGQDSRPYTFFGFVATTALVYLQAEIFLLKKIMSPNLAWKGFMMVASAMALFLLYNIIAGGNPPKQTEATAEKKTQ